MPALRIIALFCALLMNATTSHAERHLLVLGDSLSAAFGIATESGWVHLLNQRLQDSGTDWKVINASVSGETSAGGLSRLPALLETHKPSLLVIALGSNDALQGKPPRLLENNLQRMAKMASANDARVLIIGNHVPPNFGPQYTQRMFQTYETVAKDLGTHYVPFMLEAVATDEAFFLEDRLHPTAEAQPLILDTIWEELKSLI